MLDRRRAGVLLHPTSLPGPGPVGRLGAEARRFADFLHDAGFGVWQTLPLHPRDHTGSPYSSPSVFALEPALIDPHWLADEGLLTAEESSDWSHRESPPGSVLDAVSHRLRDTEDDGLRKVYRDYLSEQAHWLEDFALYSVLRGELNGPWHDWPQALRDRRPAALAAARRRHPRALERIRVAQFLCERQWRGVRHYANARDVLLFGDLAFFVAHDSADVWAHPDLFQLDGAGRMTANTGVPPDYFSETGQLWGMPQYDWPRIAAGGWRWWIERVRRQLTLFDLLRIDHFRGLAATWHVPPDAGEAAGGEWRPGPGQALLDALGTALGSLPLVAEDLGLITEDVTRLRLRADLPGMRVLQFAFDSDAENPYLPHNYERNTVAYTGTHDNNTLAGWWYDDCDDDLRERVRAYLGEPGEPVPDALERLLLASVAHLAVLPMQDILGLGGEARMNTPGTLEGNWRWRLWEIPADGAFVARQRRLNELYGRA